MIRIRKFDKQSDTEAVRACLIELQDYECELDPRMPAGSEVGGPLFVEMMDRCSRHHGRIFVADDGNDIAGYVTVLARIKREDIEDGDLEYGLVTDLMVRDKFRNRGIGRRLLEVAEEHATECGARWLRVEVLSNNGAARKLYTSYGFSEHLLSLEKSLKSPGVQR